VTRFLYADDLAPFVPDIDPAKAEAMIEDAEAMAALLAPCITDPGFTAAGALKAILRGAVIRWHEAGTGALQAQTAGPYSQTYDTRQERRGMFLTSGPPRTPTATRRRRGASRSGGASSPTRRPAAPRSTATGTRSPLT
jgi:hypothetical protein